MTKNSILLLIAMALSYLTGCASVPMATGVDDQAVKEFSSPPADKAGLYIYRNTRFASALRKSVYLDGKIIGETAPMTYLYREIQPGQHKLSTESEFSDNDLVIETQGGKNYFVHQHIKLGLVVSGASLEHVSEEEGEKGVLECELIK